MNFKRNNLNNIKDRYQKTSTYLSKKVKITSLKIAIVISIYVFVLLTAIGLGALKGLIYNAPNVDNLELTPKSYLTIIYDTDKNEIQRLVQEGSNRIFVPIENIPKHVQNAFIAIEDSRFRKHHGIDIKGISRAFIKGIKRRNFSEGASTITQQLIKNAIFDGGNESNFLLKIKRKIQEQYLAIEVEKKINKDKILEGYLNTINLGYNSLGIQTASKRYFNKDVKDLTISESAVIAAIPQNPSSFNPISHPEKNKERRKTVLDYMLKDGYISKKEYNDALNDDIYSQISKNNTDNNVYNYSYFTDTLIYSVIDDMMHKLGYSKKEAYNKLFSGGLKIYSTQDSKATKIANKYVNDPNFPIYGYTISYRLTIKDKDGNTKNYSDINITNKLRKEKKNNEYNILVSNKSGAENIINNFKKSLGKFEVLGEKLILIPQPQTSFSLMDSHNGEVKALIGGRGPKIGALTQNRASNSYRQPGSTIKPLLDYGPAFDLGYLYENSIILDEPYRYPNGVKVNTPYGRWFGNINLTKALAYSLNVPAIKALRLVGVENAMPYLKKMNFDNLLYESTENGVSDMHLASALGGFTYGVSNLQMTAGYATIANEGMYNKPRLYTKILDYDGNVLIDNTQETTQIFSKSTTHQLSNILSKVPSIFIKGFYNQPFDEATTQIAVKTGTTNNDMDYWLCGYSDYYAASVWVGYDNFDAAPPNLWQFRIWNNIMSEIHKGHKYRKLYGN